MKYLLFALLYCAVCWGEEPLLIKINDLGNPGKQLPFTIKKGYFRGTVNRPYRIARDEVNNQDYAEFLNACARAEADSQQLWHASMKIRRDGTAGAYIYSPENEHKTTGVSYTSRIAAARYCNWLSGETVYYVTTKERPNGATAPAIVGWRDISTPKAGRLYYLPDMHEFYKAGFYDGHGNYRKVTPENRQNASHYGLLNTASGRSEWMDNKVYAGSPFLLGAHDRDQSSEALNTEKFYQAGDGFRDEWTGFRIAASPETDIAPFLPGSRRNFYFDPTEKQGTFRIRRDGKEDSKQTVSIKILNHRDREIYRKAHSIALRPGVNDLHFPLPVEDGYYELEITVSDPAWNNVPEIIPFAVMRTPMPAQNDQGRFGFTINLHHWMNNYTLEEPDFVILRNIGTSIIRNDDFARKQSGAREIFRKVRKEGFLPLMILSNLNYQEMELSRKSSSEIIHHWGTYHIPPELAANAQYAYEVVNEYKDVIRHWEIGNEPGYWKITAEEYAQYAKAIAKAIRLADPQAIILLGDVNAIGKEIFALGAGKDTDGIAYHIYGWYNDGFWGIIGKMRTANGWKQAAGLKTKPIWLTEIGFSTFSDTHIIPGRTLPEIRRYEGIHVVKSMLGGLAFGAEKVLPYTYRALPRDYYEEDFGLCDRYGRPNHGIASFRTVSRLFGHASFHGFLKGNHLQFGKITALSFHHPDGDDLIALWRNDLYGTMRFDVPFEKIIQPPEEFRLKTSSDVELYQVGGAQQKLTPNDGEVSIPVDEYPVFIKGKICSEVDECPTIAPVEIRHFGNPVVKIINQQDPLQSCEMLSGIILDGSPGKNTVVVRTFNPTDQALTGQLRLSVSNHWREFDWQVDPAVQSMTIPADGMGTANFSITIPKHYEGKHRYIQAEFVSQNGFSITDRVLMQLSKPRFVPEAWVNYHNPQTLSCSEDGTELILKRKVQQGKTDSIFLRLPFLFAEDRESLKKKRLEISCRTDSPDLQSIGLVLKDAKGEHFLINSPHKFKPGQWTNIIFNDLETILDPQKCVSWWGDKHVDFPISLLGFQLQSHDAEANAIRIRMYQIE